MRSPAAGFSARRVPITNEKSMPEATNGARAEARPPASSRISPTQISIFLYFHRRYPLNVSVNLWSVPAPASYQIGSQFSPHRLAESVLSRHCAAYNEAVAA